MKRLIHFIVITAILALIPITFYISHTLNANAMHELKVKDIIKNISHKEVDSTKILNVRLIIRNTLKEKMEELAKFIQKNSYDKDQFWKECDKSCKNILQYIGLKAEIGIIIKYQGHYAFRCYGQNKSTSLLLEDLAKITGITDLDDKYNTTETNRHYINPILEKMMSTKIRKVFKTSLDFITIRNRTSKYRASFERQKNSLREFALIKTENKILLCANIDLSNISKEYSVIHKTRNWKDNNYGLCFINKKSKNIFVSSRVNKNSRILNWIKSSPATYSNKSSQFHVGNCIVKLADYPHSDFKHILIKTLPLKKANLSKLSLLFLTILSYISCFIFILYTEKLFLHRGPDISLQLIVFSGFILIVLIPLSALFYLSSQYSLLKFSNTKSNIENTLNSKLRKYDRKVLRQYRNRLNLLRSFNSKENIANYSNKSSNKSLHELANYFVKALQKKFKQQPCSEIWFYTPKHGIHYYLYKHRKAKFVLKNPPEYFDVILKTRFDNILNVNSNINKSKIDTLQLKQEMAKDIMLSMFGHKAYYRIYDVNDHYIRLVSKNNDHSMMTVKISFKGKSIGVICWMHGSKSSSIGNIPEIASSSSMMVLSGNKSPYNTRPLIDNIFLKTMHNVLKAGEDARFFKCPIKKQVNLGTQTAIIEAIAGKNANITIAGKMIMPNFKEKEKIISRIVSRNALYLVALALILAILSAWYFTSPIRKLTMAILKITKHDYSVRLNTAQPDEFGTIYTNFNSMAKGLEEGKLMKKFVSTSIEEEITKGINLQHSTSAQIKQTTILFSGIVSFNEILNENNPKRIFETLQKHLSASVFAIKGIDGEIDKMIEDKIMIVFESNNHALDAIKAGKIIKTELEKANIRVGIGINSGNVVSGIMGASEVRLAKTVIGDPVNLSARLASLALKNTNSNIIISGETLQQLPESFNATKLEIDKVKGKTQTIEAYLLNEGEA